MSYSLVMEAEISLTKTFSRQKKGKCEEETKLMENVKKRFPLKMVGIKFRINGLFASHLLQQYSM